MSRKSELTDKPGFSYFMSTSCENWDALEYYEEWCAAKHPISKSKFCVSNHATDRVVLALVTVNMAVVTGITREYVSPVYGIRGLKPGGYINDFWIKIDLEKNADIKEAEVSARIREIQAGKDLLLNGRSLGVLEETIVEHKEASGILTGFAHSEHNTRKRRKHGYDTPSPRSPALNNSPVEPPMLINNIDNPFFEEDDHIIAIDDIPCELSFEHGDSASDFFLGETNVSQLSGSLFVESNVHEILSLSILMLAPNSHSNLMIDLFGSPLLDLIHQELMPTQQIVLDPKCESTFREAIKMATKSRVMMPRNVAHVENKNEHSETTHITNYLDRIMRGFFDNPNQHIVPWPNTALERLKAEKDNVYKNCNDLIRLGVFMKDCQDSAIDKGADIKVIGFQCIDYKIDYYIMDLVRGIYTMVYIGQVTIPASIKEMSAFVDEMETLLKIQEIFLKSFNTLYVKLCIPSPPSKKVTFKRDTLYTPKFRQLVSKTRNCHRSCPFWFGRF
ncbi:1370_t:CDS:2 [Ambispora gerdemannii]|uniref:1370_t:CDS:1 n=1 Tax=Ambispora gerdemannii TaxID=144530 RepID=A0A9N9GUT6_9GLOM|nr:1370_t:CDS:2 [Ambispora gerdemannii]